MAAQLLLFGQAGEDRQGLPAIREMPLDQQPAYRLAHQGANALSDAELLAMVLATPNGLSDAGHVLGRFEGLPGIARASLAELQALPGVGRATAARIKAALELGRRLLVTPPAERPQVRSPADAANLLMAEMALLEQEELRVVLLDTRNRVIAIRTVYRGSLNSAVVRVAEVFRDAIRENAAAILVVHNHPSSDPTPSPEDVQVTRSIVEVGKTLSIDVLDHIVLGGRRYVSLKERGLGFR